MLKDNSICIKMNNVIIFLGLCCTNSVILRNFFIHHEEIHNLYDSEVNFLSLARNLETSEFMINFSEEKNKIIKEINQYNDKKNYYLANLI